MPSAAPPSGETPRGISLTGGSLPTSQTKTGSSLALPQHRTSPPFSYPLPPFPISSPAVPILPDPSGGSVPPPANRCWWTTTLVPSTRTKIPLSEVSHTQRRPTPYASMSPQPPTYVDSYLSRASTLMKLIATD